MESAPHSEVIFIKIYANVIAPMTEANQNWTLVQGGGGENQVGADFYNRCLKIYATAAVWFSI